MTRQRTWAALVLGAAALLLTPAVGSAQHINMVRSFGIAPLYYGPYPSYYSYGNFPYSWAYSPWAPVAGTYYVPSYYTSANSWYNPGWTPSYATTNYYSTPLPSSSTSTATGTGTSYSYGSTARSDANTTLLKVRLPDKDAEVWVEGKRTEQRGTSREFISPPLDPNQTYIYDVRARWTKNGLTTDTTRRVRVHANDVATIDFTGPANNSRVDEIDRRETEKVPPAEIKR
jgi:uncharacterized protein (TIGR03000 family)